MCPQPHYHAVQFYKDSQSLAATVAKFLAEGFSSGQPAVMVATIPHVSAVFAELEKQKFAPEKLRATGELQVFDARKMLSSFMLGSRPDSLMFKSNAGDVIHRLCAGRQPSPIRVYGEMVDLLWQEGNADGAIRLEILWNQLASAYDFSLLCGYSVGHFYKERRDDAGFADVCRHHSHVVEAAR